MPRKNNQQWPKRFAGCFLTGVVLITQGLVALAQPQDPAVGQVKGMTAGSGLPVITDTHLREHVRVLTMPVMEGRRAGTTGDRTAATYIAEQFRRAGLVPVGDNNTFFQSFQFESWQPVPVTAMSQLDKGTVKKSYTCEWSNSFTGRDFRPVPRSGQGSVTAPVVFVGHGLSEPELNLDDYAGVDVRDKTALILLGDGPLPAGRTRTEPAILTAKKRGARACLLAYPASGYPVVDPNSAPLVALSSTESTTGMVVMAIRNSVRDELLASRGSIQQIQAALQAAKPVSGPTGMTVQLDLRAEAVPVATSSNVVALLPGSDPQLREETLVLVTYRDGQGVDAEGKLCPGANDNAAGVAALLETARLLASAKPARSILFVAYGGEFNRFSPEAVSPGLAHFLAHPVTPWKQVAGIFVFDRIGLNTPNRIALENIALYPELFLKLRSGLPELNALLVPGSYSIEQAAWPAGVPMYRFKDPSERAGRALQKVLYPTEDTPDRLRLESLRVYTGLLTRILGYLASNPAEPLVMAWSQHLDAAYRATVTDFVPISPTEFYQRAASVRRDYLTDIITYIPGGGDARKLNAAEKRQQFIKELLELRENLFDQRSRLRPVRDLADLEYGPEGQNLAADNQLGVWIGLDSLDWLSEQSPVETITELMSNGLQLVIVNEKSARLLVDGSPALIEAIQSPGLLVLVGELDGKRRQKLFPLLKHPVLVADSNLSDDELNALAEAGHLVVVMPRDGDQKTDKRKKTVTPKAMVERLVHLLEVIGEDQVLLSTPELSQRLVLIEELAKQGLSPTQVEKVFGLNFKRFYAAPR
ncbi:MAG: M28 family peptidase [Acidobacteria bacterium]|nr:M28 family peptidase [Acidobacteriota bacterium]